MYKNRSYVIFDVSELDNLNFSEVLETSAETVRKSVDGTKTFVKWKSDESVPLSVETLSTKGPYLTHEEILAILLTPAWSAPHEL